MSDLTPRLRSLRFSSKDLIGFQWSPGQDVMFQVPRSERVRRRYTIRRCDPTGGTLDIEVVLHGDGPFARWASTATVGDRIRGVGPRGNIALRADASHHLFVGDESAVPAISSMIEALRLGETDAAAVIASDTAPPDVAPTAPQEAPFAWVPNTGLVEWVRTVPLAEGTTAYVLGELALVRDAARELTARGLSSDAMATKAYWRRDQPNADHGEPARR